MCYTHIELSIGIRAGTLVLFVMDSALYAFMHVLDVDECNMPCVCDNVSMSDDPLDCDAMLHESFGVVDIHNIKLFKKNAKKFQKNLSKLFCEKNDLIAKLKINWSRNIRILLKILLKS